VKIEKSLELTSDPKLSNNLRNVKESFVTHHQGLLEYKQYYISAQKQTGIKKAPVTIHTKKFKRPFFDILYGS
jgi:hypothetical protein